MSRQSRSLARAQAEYDSRTPPDDSPMRICERCREEYNNDEQELDADGKSLCDSCVEKINKEQDL